MPTTYAHSSFGEKILKNVEGNVKDIINKNIELFNIGLHGPDILFYYKPLSSNHVNKIGHELHSKTVDLFLKRAKNIISDSQNKDAAFSYIAGFISHFMLDSYCHPFVRQIELKNISHSTIEAELDRFLMIKNNLQPLTFKPTKHIIPKAENAKCISMFYDGVSSEEILSALKSMKMHLNILVAPGKLKRNLIITSLKLFHHENMIDLMMSLKPSKESADYTKELINLYESAIIPTAEIINEYYQNLNENIELNNRFNRNFG